jgi:hypothetical protein
MISAISSIVYLVLYAMNNFVQYPFMVIQNQMQVSDNTASCYLGFIFKQIQVIALFVLILRIIQGKAWTRRTDDVDTTDHSLPSDIEDFPSRLSGLRLSTRSEACTLVFAYRTPDYQQVASSQT